MLRLLKISGDSLSPEFQIGDFVLISKIPYFFAPPTRGDVVAFHQPGYGTLIKRIEALTPDGTLTVMGTHPDSVDSRTFGPVRQSDLLGKVIRHIRRS